MYKERDVVREAIRRHFAKCVCETVAREALGLADDAWPYAVSLGKVSTSELTREAVQVSAYAAELQAWCGRQGLGLRCTARRFGAVQELPTHVVVPTIDGAAGLCGAEGPRELRRLRARAVLLRDQGGIAPELRTDASVMTRVLRTTEAWEDIDYELLLQAAGWFACHDAIGQTPRQVPLEGFHAKWLDSQKRRELLCLLAAKDELGVVDRPDELSYAYLDPAWLAAGGRRYDSLVAGDAHAPAYEPSFVLVVENKDTYLWFPQAEGGICVFGSGMAGPALLAGVDWVRSARKLYYWGDMDADGYVILDAYRAQGLPVTSVLMDAAAYERYERYGTREASGRRALTTRKLRELPHLTADERAVYERLCDPSWEGMLRVEQERIPLSAALEALHSLLL